jgi:hypothetical protein
MPEVKADEWSVAQVKPRLLGKAIFCQYAGAGKVS